MLMVKNFGNRHRERSEGTQFVAKNREHYPILIAVAGDWKAIL
jgi:hypothetical protein